MKRESIGRLLLGFGTGKAFGLLLQKGRVAKHTTIVKQLLFEDWTVLKIMGTATAVGAIGTQVLGELGLAKKKIKPLKLGGIVLGGTLFGSGMALLGYCPGTTVAAVGEGHKDAVAGVIGMLVGAAAFVKLYPRIKSLIDKGDLGEKTLPELTGISPWTWIVDTAAAVMTGATALKRISRD